MMVSKCGAKLLLPFEAVVTDVVTKQARAPLLGINLLTRIQAPFRRMGYLYARTSERRPYLVAGLTASSILTAADLSSQVLETMYAVKHSNGVTVGLDRTMAWWDWRRTLSLALFGMCYYGGPCKFLYLGYDRWFKSAVLKTAFDTCIHTPFCLIPSFYAITCTIKGKAPSDTFKQLKEEWVESSFGSLCFWFPTCCLNFFFVPQHSRLMVVSIMSFFHKTWLSWLSNRKRNQEIADQRAFVGMDAPTQKLDTESSVSVTVPTGLADSGFPAFVQTPTLAATTAA